MEDFDGSSKDQRSRRKLNLSKNAIMSQEWGNKITKLLPGSFPLGVQETEVESHSSGKLKQEIPMPEMQKYDGGSWDLDNFGVLNDSNNVQNTMIGQETNVESRFQGDAVLNHGCTNESYEHLPGQLPFKGQGTNVESHFPGSLVQAIPMEASTSKGLNVNPLEEVGWLDILNNVDNLNKLNNVNNVSNSMIEEWLGLGEVMEVKGYTIFKSIANVLNEIFQNHPDIDQNFRVKYPEFQSFILKSLTEVYQKIESKPEMLKLEEIQSMEEKIQDMELTGLQLSWLKEKLEEIRKTLKVKAEMKRLREEITSKEAELIRKKEKLANLEKEKKP